MIEIIRNNLFNIGVVIMIVTAFVNFYWRTKGLLSSDKDESESIYHKIVLHWGFLLAYLLAVALMQLDSYVN